MAESFFATLEHELIAAHDWATHTQARRDIFVFIEEWYNRERQHSSLGYVNPRAVRAGSLRALGASSVNHVSVKSSQVHIAPQAILTQCPRASLTRLAVVERTTDPREERHLWSARSRSWR